MNSTNTAPTSATQAKECLYTQLAGSLGRMSRAISQTADLCEQLQVDLHAMRVLAGLDAAKFMTVATLLTPGQEDGEGEISSDRDQGTGEGKRSTTKTQNTTQEDSDTKGKKSRF
ncbi:hypothetical protein BYT27DRAFT_7198355 [Phlegmacium glaucopus]|nr:hypothetical protein BYT27DRAFT_7198355 [Phlegmacium glaucopus]